MSRFPTKTKKKSINIKSLILQQNDNIINKYKNLKLSLLDELFYSNEGQAITERNEKFQKKSSRKKLEDIYKTTRESKKKSRKCDKNFLFLNNHGKNRNKCTSIKRDGSDSLNNMISTYRENNKTRNLLLEYSGIKAKKQQKFIQINNKKFINKKKLININKFFFKSNGLINNLSRNNNNTSFKTNNSNNFYETDLNNFTQKSIYIENKKLNPLFKKYSKDKNVNHSKNKINNKNSRNIIQLLINNSYRNNKLNSKLKENLSIFKSYNVENKIKNKSNSKNHSNYKIEKKKRIQLLIKQEKKSLNKTLPYREKILNDIKKNIVSKNKYKSNQTIIKKINLVKKANKPNNIITTPNNSKITKIQKIKEEKNVKDDLTKINNNLNNNNLDNNNNTSENSKKNNEQNLKKVNPKYTKKIIFSPTPPKTKENTITIKDQIYKKVIKIDSCTLAGYSSSGVQKINQDNLFIQKNFLDEKDQFFIGVCDGHGDWGHSVSSYIAKCLPNFLADTSDKNIISSYNSLNQNLVQNSKIDCQLSGTTCSSIILNPEKIISINLGDSRSVLAKYENGIYTAINLTTDHKPNIGSEKKRILINGGRIKPFYDEKTKKFLGPDRVWIREDDIPGLAMTRSFGDTIAHSAGVTSEPEIKKYDLTGNEKFIIIASDGIWEYISSEECVKIVKEFYENNFDAVGAINAIMKEAFNRWKKFDEIIDDITAIIIFFDSK